MIEPPPGWWRDLRPGSTTNDLPINLAPLDILAGLACLAAVALIILWALGRPVPCKAAAACILTAVGAWTLKFMMVKFLWIIAALSLIALVLFAVVLYHTNSSSIRTALRFGPRHRPRTDAPPDPTRSA